MLNIAAAIDERRDLCHKRCAVQFRDGGAYFYSPRNTNEDPKPVTLDDADALAALIRRTLT